MTVRSITMDELDHLGLDEENRLYWRERRVVTKLSAPWWAATLASLATLSTIVIAVVAILKYLEPCSS